MCVCLCDAIGVGMECHRVRVSVFACVCLPVCGSGMSWSSGGFVSLLCECVRDVRVSLCKCARVDMCVCARAGDSYLFDLDYRACEDSFDMEDLGDSSDSDGDLPAPAEGTLTGIVGKSVVITKSPTTAEQRFVRCRVRVRMCDRVCLCV